MPDWNILIAERLGELALPQQIGDEVVTELAAHLEEFCKESCARGTSESEAMERALAQVADWQGLGLAIADAKNEEERMNDRTKQLWLPGLAALTASMLWLMILQGLNWHSQTVLFHASPLMKPFLIWLLTQPIFGATGAFLSRRAGGDRKALLVAGIFPSIVMFGVLAFGLLIAIFVERNRFVLEHPVQLVLVFLPWVVFPALTLLAGVVPFLKRARPASAPS